MKMSTGYQDTLFVSNHKDAYKQIRNFLAGRFVGATRDRALLEEVVKCLFCRVRIEEKGLDSDVSDAVDLSKLYRKVFSDLKETLPSVFDEDDEILLDPASIEFVDTKLRGFKLDDVDRDPFGDLYEVLIGTGIREEEGQFFTPQNGIELLVELVDPQPGDKIIDPACGAGGFLSSAAKHLLDAGADRDKIASNVFGIEKDSYLTKLAATRLSLLSQQSSKVFCGDSLAWINQDGNKLSIDRDQSYDIVLTNPPFGKNIVSASDEVQATFHLGYKWKRKRSDGTFKQTDKLPKSVPPQVLFVERCLDLLKPGGRLGIVVPESLITSKSYRHVVQFLRERGKIEAVLGMPEAFFKTSGKGGTHTKACLLKLTKKEEDQTNGSTKLFLAEAEYCGHNSRGQQIERDDLPKILSNFQQFENGGISEQSHLGYELSREDIIDNILSPRYYDPEVDLIFEKLRETHNLVKMGDLMSEGLIEKSTGHEVGRAAYGTGDIPFVRTSDISNWEVKVDPKHCVSEDIYDQYSDRQDLRAGDILMVKDGTYLIGTCAMVTEYDKRMVFQSHLYKLRVTDQEKLSPYLLLAVLSSDPVQRQIKAKRFTQDIIDSLGKRIHELTLPIPKDQSRRAEITETVKKAMQDRIEARELTRRACLEVVKAA
jgi:type I restriction enzyme M protein